MPCGCGKSKTRIYLVTYPDKSTEEAKTLTAAMNLVRAKGGHYEVIKR